MKNIFRYLIIIAFSGIFTQCNNSKLDNSKENNNSQRDNNKESNSDVFVGNWVGCGYNKNDNLIITKDGDNYIYKDGKNELALKKISEKILEGMGGIVNLRFDSELGHLKLLDGGPVEEFKRDNKSNRVADKNVDLKKFIGEWVALAGDKEISFTQIGSDISIKGNGFFQNLTNERTNIIRYEGTIYAQIYFSNGEKNSKILEYYIDKDHIGVMGDEYERKK